MINVIKHYKVWLWGSFAAFVLAVVALIVFGLNFGIDFKGGSLTQVAFENERPSVSQIQATLREAGFEDAVVQPAGDNSALIRTGPRVIEDHTRLMDALAAAHGNITEEQFTSIGPAIGRELRTNALVQLVLVSLGILLYVAYAFRKVSKPVSSWRFGASAVIGLIHDLVIVLGIFAILGKLYGIQIDGLFVTAMLTILGFSVHDTIVVFDRIRENLRVRAGQSMAEIVQTSVDQTIVRSINTSVTALFVLLALFFFGGDSIRYFVLALLIGIAIGTYSSIFVSSPLLIVWHNWELKRRG